MRTVRKFSTTVASRRSLFRYPYMQEKLNRSKLVRRHAVPLRRSQQRQHLPNNMDDVVDDLFEIRHLINDLAGVEDAPGWFYTNYKQEVQALKSRHRRLLDLIEKASKYSSNETLNNILIEVRVEYLALKNAIRNAYRQKGTALCLGDWQSPIYDATYEAGQNRLTNGVAEHVLDYKRDGHLDAIAYEKEYVEEYLSHLGCKNLKAYLSNSGMGSFSTAIQWIAHESNIATNVRAMAVMPMYFENIHLARGYFQDLIQVDMSAQGISLLASLRLNKPNLVICDNVTNCGEVMFHDVDTVLKWAKEETSEPVTLLIDTTCLPVFLMPYGWLADLPEHVSVIMIESLAKYHQFGMDTVTGGIMMAQMSEASHSSFAKARARFGANISDSSVGALPQPNYSRLERRMKRHARNTSIVARALQSISQNEKGIIQSVSWLDEKLSPDSIAVNLPWFTGTCLTVRMQEGFKSIPQYREFEYKVMEKSREYGLPIALSTSFGFDTTRLYVTAPATKFEPPFLRISIGTETSSQIATFVRILEEVNTELGKTMKPSIVANETAQEKIAVAKPRVEVVSDSKIQSSVFLGDKALQNYLSPANIACPPLVELPADLNPYAKDGVRIMAKMMPLVPLMNIKSVPAYSMMSEAFARGDLSGVKNVIESSSSNTVLSLSVISRLFGIDNTVALVDDSIAPSLTRMLRLFGIEVYKHPGPGHELYGKVMPRSSRATDCGAQPGWINPGQYGNPDNPEGFAKWLAPDLYRQTQGKLDILSCALGTCGTMVGVSRGLRMHNPDIKVVACCPGAGEVIPGPREKAQLSDVTFDWQNVANARFELEATESFAASVKLLRRGIMGGPSSGMNYAGLLKYLETQKEAGLLNQDKETWSVFLCCDSPLPHVEEYYEALGEDFFPSIHGVDEEIL